MSLLFAEIALFRKSRIAMASSGAISDSRTAKIYRGNLQPTGLASLEWWMNSGVLQARDVSPARKCKGRLFGKQTTLELHTSAIKAGVLKIEPDTRELFGSPIEWGVVVDEFGDEHGLL